MHPAFRIALLCCALQPVVAHDGGLLQHATKPLRRSLAEAPFPVVTGSGTLAYQTVPGWGTVPGTVNIGPTHGGVVVDKAGHIYVSSDGKEGLFVFKPDGALVKKIAPEFSGIHGLMIREEDGKEFIYAAHLRSKHVVKLDLDGKAILKLGYPKEANAYPDGNGYAPTGVTVGPDGAIFVADGYGKSLIHKYDAAGKYIKTFGGKGNTDTYAGYVSWSPSEVFDRAYRKCDGMTFGQAIEALKVGQKVARAGWNGKGMFLYYVPAAEYPASRNTLGTMVGFFPNDMVPYGAYIAMKTAQNNVVPWLASQTDVLAEDWSIQS
jgi:DNA-binding beta-propeller fold protein YncE